MFLSHGFRFVRLAADFAAPVATCLDPVRGQSGIADSVTLAGRSANRADSLPHVRRYGPPDLGGDSAPATRLNKYQDLGHSPCEAQLRQRLRPPPLERTGHPLRPSGAGGSGVFVSHGLRCVRLAADFAAPVATCLYPFRGQSGIAESVTYAWVVRGRSPWRAVTGG